MTGDRHLQHINVNVDDLGTAVPFYRDVLGLPLDDTPDQGFPSQFFRLAPGQQIHMNELQDGHPFRAHFCIELRDFTGVFRRAKAAGAIDLEPWGRVRRLPNGKMQMFVRDPSGNLIEVGSTADAEVDPSLFDDDLVEPEPGIYRIPPGEAAGRHETG